MYNKRLKIVHGIRLPYIAQETTKMSWFVYVVKFQNRVTRDSIMQELQKWEIPSRPTSSRSICSRFVRNNSTSSGEIILRQKKQGTAASHYLFHLLCPKNQ